MTKDTKLKPCPFCNGKAEIVKCRVYLDEARRVRCTQCHIVTPPILIDHPAYTEKSFGELDESTRYTEKQAEEKVAVIWNRRAEKSIEKGVE